MKIAIVPIIKNQTRDTSDKNSYRRIALLTAAEDFQNLYFRIIGNVDDHQFGFKGKHSTDISIFIVKSIIKYYTRQNSPVYSPVF